jgi:hypothetical protein
MTLNAFGELTGGAADWITGVKKANPLEYTGDFRK